MPVNLTIARNIKVLREKFGYNQDLIGQVVGVSHTIISRYESGDVEIPLKVLEKLALFYGIDEYDFYEDCINLQQANAALAFRADDLKPEDMSAILEFKKIVRNYLKMQKANRNE